MFLFFVSASSPLRAPVSVSIIRPVIVTGTTSVYHRHSFVIENFSFHVYNMTITGREVKPREINKTGA